MDTVKIGAGLVGRVIDSKFPLLQWLGGWEGSGVYLTDLEGSQRVAIKVTLASYASAQAQLARWVETAKISHPHLMKLLRTGKNQVDTTGVVYSVTEYADEVLADILRERALKPNEVKELLVPVLDALFYLHGKGYVHGHLKPSNILVVRNQLLLSGDGLQVAGEPGKWFRGLTDYDAPESGEAMMAPSADVWSLGMLLVAALTQKPAEWDRESGKEPVIPEGIPQPFARITRECLRLDPKRRCTLADVNKWRYEQVHADDEPLEKSRTAVADAPQYEVNEGGKRGLIAVAVAVVLLAAFAVVHWWPGQRKSPAMTASTAQSAGVEKTNPAAGRVVKHEQAEREEQAAKPAVEKPQAGIPETASTPNVSTAETTTGAATNAPNRNAAAESERAVPAPAASVGSGAAVQRVLPEAPQAALDTIHGTVRVKIEMAVDANGNVTDATFQDAGPSKYFARMALAAAQKWRFAPGAAGERVVEFDFRQTGVEAALQ